MTTTEGASLADEKATTSISGMQRLGDAKAAWPVRRRRRPRIASVVATLIMAILAAYFLLPLLWLLLAATKSTSDLFGSGAFTLAHFQLFQNIAELSTYNSGYFWNWYGNSIIYSGATALGSTLICALAGYALAKYRFRGQRIISTSIICSLVVPAAALAVPTFLLLTKVGLVNSYVGVILPGLPNAFGAYFLYTYIREAMPEELIDAGRVDGAGDWRIFFRIALPIIQPGVVTYLLISFIASWNNFFLPLLILNDPSKFPLTLGLNNWLSLTSAASALGQPPYAQLVTGSLLSVIPMLVLFPLFRKQIAAGMATGSVK
jgi:multiple sugar transport system permease protein